MSNTKPFLPAPLQLPTIYYALRATRELFHKIICYILTVSSLYAHFFPLQKPELQIMFLINKHKVIVENPT